MQPVQYIDWTFLVSFWECQNVDWFRILSGHLLWANFHYKTWESSRKYQFMYRNTSSTPLSPDSSALFIRYSETTYETLTSIKDTITLFTIETHFQSLLQWTKWYLSCKGRLSQFYSITNTMLLQHNEMETNLLQITYLHCQIKVKDCMISFKGKSILKSKLV